MSIRDELFNLTNEIEEDDYDLFAGELIDLILVRYGVVELPEPDSVTEPMDEFQGLAEWKTDLARIGEFDDGDGFIDMEPHRLMSISPSDMRDLAAALLAAANRAESADVDR